MRLPDSHEYPLLDIRGDLVSHDGLKLWLLQAEIREEGTLIGWVELPHEGGLRTQIEQIPFPDGEEGLWHCVGSG